MERFVEFLKGQILTSVVTAMIMAAAVTVWQSVTKGGLVSLLGGVTRAEFMQTKTDRGRLEGFLNRQWQDVTSSRNDGQCYRNNTDYPIEISVTTAASTGRQRRNYNFCHLEIRVEQAAVLRGINNNDGGGTKHCVATATIPPRRRYEVVADGHKEGGIFMWWELRHPTDAGSPAAC